MRIGMLEALRRARGESKPVLRVVPLNGSVGRLVDEAGLALLDRTDPELAAAGRRALAEDRALTAMLMQGETLLVPHNPPLRLVIMGAVHIAESLCRLAMETGYAVTVIDPRSAFARPDRFAGVTLINEWPQQALPKLRLDARTAVVLLTHDPKIDDPALIECVRSRAFYIGALGSTRTHAKRLERLRAAGLEEAALERIHGPAGLAIAARTPAEIAISVLAQMTQVLRKAGA
jgi:xanthine dehydrogenase accessory factor